MEIEELFTFVRSQSKLMTDAYKVLDGRVAHLVRQCRITIARTKCVTHVEMIEDADLAAAIPKGVPESGTL